MKVLNVNSKPSGLFIKGITAVSLSLVLQGKATCIGPGGTAGYMATHMEHKQFQTTLDNTKDISLPDEKNRSILYATVKYNELEKVKIILKRYNEDMASGSLHKNPDFINARDPKYNDTPLEATIIEGSGLMFNLLIQNKYINVKTIDPILGNTTLHLAIKNKRADVAKKLINLFKTQLPDLLFAQNKDGDAPLHLAMAYKLPDVQDVLIKLLSENKENLWIKNKKGKTAVDVAIKNDQAQGILLIKELPLKALCNKNKKGATLLHKAAYKNKLNVFKLVLDRTNKLAGTDEVIKHLASKTQDGKSVWQCIYLSQLGGEPVSSSTNIKMFKHAISSVKDNLKTVDQLTILEDVNRQEHISRLKGGISKGYADTLRKIVG